jgi:gamma-glutamylaminecyclotransferase
VGRRGAHGGNVASSGRGRARGEPGTREPRPASSGATARFLVNGSLMSGEAKHQLLAVPGARLIMADARTEPEYELRDLGAFPGMVRGGAGKVTGEVYEVDEATLAALDRLEGHPRFYTRTRIAPRGQNDRGGLPALAGEGHGTPGHPDGGLASTPARSREGSGLR